MATSKLQEYVATKLMETFGNLTIHENYRPDWMRGPKLERLELDFYIPELKIAIEVQGKQHYEYVEFFHKSVDDFEYRKLRDTVKHDLCTGRGISLVLIHTELDTDILIGNLKEKIQEPEPISISLDTSFYYYGVRKALQEATNSIRKSGKSKGFRLKASSKTAEAIYKSLRHGVELSDDIKYYYDCNKEQVDHFLREKIEGKLARELHLASQGVANATIPQT